MKLLSNNSRFTINYQIQVWHFLPRRPSRQMNSSQTLKAMVVWAGITMALSRPRGFLPLSIWNCSRTIRKGPAQQNQANVEEKCLLPSWWRPSSQRGRSESTAAWFWCSPPPRTARCARSPWTDAPGSDPGPLFWNPTTEIDQQSSPKSKKWGIHFHPHRSMDDLIPGYL